MSEWLLSTPVMVLSFPGLCGLLLCYVHAVVEFGPRSLRPHNVTYRPIKTRVTDWVLILRLGLGEAAGWMITRGVRGSPEEAPAPLRRLQPRSSDAR